MPAAFCFSYDDQVVIGYRVWRSFRLFPQGKGHYRLPNETADDHARRLAKGLGGYWRVKQADVAQR